MHTEHPIPPLYDGDSKILILGSFPSVKSREAMFFYGYPQNRFWKVVASVLNSDIPKTVDEKKNLLLKNNIALWDVIASCDIIGSSDSSIKNAIANNIEPILKNSQVKQIFTNGKIAHTLYEKYIFPQCKISAIPLPSTSPANAAWNFDKLLSEWKTLKKYL